MHYRMLVTVSANTGATSEQVRQKVRAGLIHDVSFCGSGGRFGHPLCDWFVIGGRWSGLLSETKRNDPYRAAMRELFPEMSRDFWPQSLVDQNRQKLDALWHLHGGTGPSPYTRSGYEELGFPDDAQLLTAELYEDFLKDYEDESLVIQNDHCKFVDFEDDVLSPDMIGRKWLVVIDYHN